MQATRSAADDLQVQIDAVRKHTHSDQYSMSLGELANLYRDREINIHPEFQRFFRWSDYQKSRLIESFLLGIPVPPIFVAQREDGVWDVVDGLQRLSTVFQLLGILRDRDGELIPPLTLRKTDLLAALDGKSWDSGDGVPSSLTQAQRIEIKRAKLTVVIIKRESSSDTKFELFQRLNTGGSHLSDQEVRNCLMVMDDPTFYDWLKGLADFDGFQSCLALTDRAKEEQYDVELALRYLVFRQIPVAELHGMGDVGEFLTDRMKILISQGDRGSDKRAFERTFTLLDRVGPNAFRRYDHSSSRWLGGFLISAYEVIALGLGHYADNDLVFDARQVEQKAQELWANPHFQDHKGAGQRGSS